MDEPLFQTNESSRGASLQLIAAGILGLFACLTILFGLINGFSKSGTHLILGICIASFSACLAVLIKWYRVGDLDPKFKLLIAGLSASLALLCIVANIYFWQSLPAIS